MKKYFVAKEGIQKGPWTLEEITQNIHSKFLSWNDYIYDEKINVWLFLFEFPSLTEFFNQSLKNPVQKSKTNANFDSYKDRVWYILKTDESYGPFTASEIVQMLQSRTLFEYDFVWRQDQISWLRVSDVSEFKPDQIKQFFEFSTEEKSEIEKTFFRRRFPRAEYKCELLIHDQQNVYSAESIEISAGGASFKLDNVNFKVEDHIYLHFKPGGDVPAFNASCKVVSKNSNKYGVLFTNISNTVKEQIVKYTKKAA
jgi:hypothetical protein